MKKYLLSIVFVIFGLSYGISQFSSKPILICEGTNMELIGSKLADIDLDGDLDLLSTYRNAIYWHENDGAGNFSIDKEILRIDNRLNKQVIYKDITNDSIKDLVFLNYYAKGIGQANFEKYIKAFTFPVTTLYDVNIDGALDIISGNNNKVYWQKNIGNGIFETEKVLFDSLFDIMDAYDLNQDGYDDLIISKDDALYAFINKYDNTFSSYKLFDFKPDYFIIKDFNNDNKTDIITAQKGQLNWYEHDKAGQIRLVQEILGYLSGGIALGDLDYDGMDDLLVGFCKSPLHVAERSRYYHFNIDSSSFDSNPISYNPYNFEWNLLYIADIDGDSKNDIFIDRRPPTKPSWMKNNNLNDFFSDLKLIGKVFERRGSINTIDADNDFDTDVLTDGYFFENISGGDFKERVYSSFYGNENWFKADLDSDNLIDVAYPFGNSVNWKKNLGNNNFSSPHEIENGLVTSCKLVAGADLDNDGDIDLLAGNGTETVDINARFYWFENDGNGNFTPHLLLSPAQFCNDIFTEDYDEDGDLDILLIHEAGKTWFENMGNGNFEIVTNGIFLDNNESHINIPLLEINKVQKSAKIDLDGDGRIDEIISTRDWGITKTFWYRNLGSGKYSGEILLFEKLHKGSYGNMYFDVLDANFDGIYDLVVIQDYKKQLFYLEGKGNGKFKEPKLIASFPFKNSSNLGGIASLDINEDNKIDIIFANDTKGFDQLLYFPNETPFSDSGMNIISNYYYCIDNGTPDYPNDDKIKLMLNINGNKLSNGYSISTSNGFSVYPDTVSYNQPVYLNFDIGSAYSNRFSLFITDLQESHHRLNIPINAFPCIEVSNDIGIDSIKIEKSNCYDIKPILKIINNGVDTLEKIEILYSLNNGELKSYIWSGILAPKKSKSIKIASIPIDYHINNYNLNFFLHDDQLEFNNSKSISYKNKSSRAFSNIIKFEIQPDSFPSETTWEIVDNGNGESLLTGGPYHDFDLKIDSLIIYPNKCYKFSIHDRSFDGICCGQFGDGYFKVYDKDSLLFSGGDFLDKEVYYIQTSDFSNSDNVDLSKNNIQIIPNPAMNTILIKNASNLSVKIFDMLGNLKIHHKKISNDETINIDNLNSGSYIVRISSKGQYIVRKIIVIN